MNTISIIIVILYSYILLYHIKDKDYLSMLLLTFITAILICSQKNKSIYEGLDSQSQWKKKATKEEIEEASKLSGADDTMPNQQQKFTIKNDPIINKFNLVKHRMGPYDGLCLSSIKEEKKYDLINNDNLSLYLGVQGPLQNAITDNNSLMGPSIDGDPSSPNRLFMLSNNKTSIDCCEDSNYSTSNGCICMTDKQKKYINSRGANKSSSSSI
jgi:hypothetical protein